mgnify:CR=1 FL=1
MRSSSAMSSIARTFGAPVIEPGMTEQDFKDLADAGVRLLGEIGLGGVKDGPTAHKMASWARKYGIQSTIHTGGPSIPGSGLIDKDVVLEGSEFNLVKLLMDTQGLPFDGAVQKSVQLVNNYADIFVERKSVS